jgi:hypothetical protein
MDKKDALKLLNEDINKIESSEMLNLDEVKSKKGITGVYYIYEWNNSKKDPIYIGHTNKFHVRVNDLKHKSTHTLHKKLLNELETSVEVKDFLTKKCKYKIVECGKSTEKDAKILAEAIEHLAILIHKPKYNANIYQKKILNL